MALRHDELTAAGARVAGLSVDDVGRNAAMVAKLRLPFPLLADPGGDGAIKAYDVWHAEEKGGIARPAVILIDRDGVEAFRAVARDFADRTTEDDVVAQVNALDLPPTTQPAPLPGDPVPGPTAFRAEFLAPYFRGVKFAATAIGMRVEAARDETDALRAEVERYADAVAEHLPAGS